MQSKTIWGIVLGSACVLLLIAVVGGFAGRDTAEEGPAIPRVRSTTPELPRETIREQLQRAQEFEPPNPRDRVLDTIAEHRAEVERNPDSPEAPALLDAAGNLYMQIEDYELAAWSYQEVLLRYPDYPGRYQVYPRLVTAYERLGDFDSVRRILMEMLDVFPADSPFYEWAADMLEIEPWEGPEFVYHYEPIEGEDTDDAPTPPEEEEQPVEGAGDDANAAATDEP